MAQVTGGKPLVTADRPKRRRGPPQSKHAKTVDDKAGNESKAQQGDDANEGVTDANRDAEYEPTLHGEPKSSAPNKLPPIRGPPIPAAAYSIAEFCMAHRLSESMYFKMRAQGLGPDEMIIGSRRIISYEAAERWRRAREREAVGSTA